MLGEAERDALDRDWPGWAHDGQPAPHGDWSVWVLMAGRGFGKTLAGAQWITSLIAADAARGAQPLRIALVGATLEDARRVMIEGKSGLLEVAGAWVTDWHPSLRRLRFRTGAEATLFS
ncbi:MAG: terminase family protein, partial [Pseudomonadota bacterium]